MYRFMVICVVCVPSQHSWTHVLQHVWKLRTHVLRVDKLERQGGSARRVHSFAQGGGNLGLSGRLHEIVARSTTHLSEWDSQWPPQHMWPLAPDKATHNTCDLDFECYPQHICPNATVNDPHNTCDHLAQTQRNPQHMWPWFWMLHTTHLSKCDSQWRPQHMWPLSSEPSNPPHMCPVLPQHIWPSFGK